MQDIMDGKQVMVPKQIHVAKDELNQMKRYVRAQVSSLTRKNRLRNLDRAELTKASRIWVTMHCNADADDWLSHAVQEGQCDGKVQCLR